VEEAHHGADYGVGVGGGAGESGGGGGEPARTTGALVRGVFWCAIFFNSLVCELTARCAGQNSEEESGFCGHCELLGLIFFGTVWPILGPPIRPQIPPGLKLDRP
jgi:hypothetical protein